jgi:hypothetical protein
VRKKILPIAEAPQVYYRKFSFAEIEWKLSFASGGEWDNKAKERNYFKTCKT